MNTRVTIVVNGATTEVAAGISLAAALLNAGVMAFRLDLDGAPRGPLCGMGTCFECRVMADGIPGVRSCLVPVSDGMIVETE